MKPRLPNRATRDINLVKRDTWNALVDCVAYAMEHPRGDGRTILNLGDGNLQARGGGSGGRSGVSGTSGMFSIVEGDDGTFKVMDTSPAAKADSAGIAHVNNKAFDVAAASFRKPTDGTLYVLLHYDAESLLQEAVELSGIAYDGAQGATPTLCIETASELPESTFGHTYYLIGRVAAKDGVVSISQDHRPGNLYMQWYGYAVGIGEEVVHA